MGLVHILLAEDDARMAALLDRGFTEEGNVVDCTASGLEALELARTIEFDVLILDVMLPDVEGFDVVHRLRSAGNRAPVLMLTARDATTDIVQGLNAGADDYLTKPFSFDVLLARVQALARRGPAMHPVHLQVSDLILDPASHRASRAGAALPLTRTEFRLLEHLMRRGGRVVTRQALIEGVWGCGRQVEDNTLDAFIRLLRQKVDGPGRPPLIHTARGIGYSVREAV